MNVKKLQEEDKHSEVVFASIQLSREGCRDSRESLPQGED